MYLKSLLDEPNPNSPANSQAAQLYQENKREYEKRVSAIVEQSWRDCWPPLSLGVWTVSSPETRKHWSRKLTDLTKMKWHILIKSFGIFVPLTVAKFVCRCVVAFTPAECCCWAIAYVWSKLMYLVISGLLATCPNVLFLSSLSRHFSTHLFIHEVMWSDDRATDT